VEISSLGVSGTALLSAFDYNRPYFACTPPLGLDPVVDIPLGLVKYKRDKETLFIDNLEAISRAERQIRS
jgi:hypothetical protein